MMASEDVHPLVPGSVKGIVEGTMPSSIWLQVIYIKPGEKDGSGGASKYKMALSDSIHFIQSLVLGQLTNFLEQNLVAQNDIIRVTNYTLSGSKGLTYLLIRNIDLEDIVHAGSKYGAPTNIEQYVKMKGLTIDPSIMPLAMTETGVGMGMGMGTTSTTIPSSSSSSISNFNHSNIVNTPYGAAAITPPIPPPSNSTSRNNPFQSNIGRMVGADSKYTTSSLTSTRPTSDNAAAFEEPEALQSIASLSPYHNRWSIKARVINKSEVRRFANPKGEGKLFSVTCIDNTGEIRMTAFGEVVDKFFDLIVEGQVYYISQAQVRIAKRQFGVRNEYEIHLEPTSLIVPARDGGQVPLLKYNFVPISQIVNLEKDSTCDVIGIAKDVGELNSITIRTTQKQTNKRDITLVDTSGCAVRVTLWGIQAESFVDNGTFPVVAIRSTRVSDYNGRTISTSASSIIHLNPDIREAHELRGWYDARGSREEFRSISVASSLSGTGAVPREDRKTIAQIKEEHLGQGEKPDYFTVYGTIAYIKSDAAISYSACPTEGCNKKVIEEGPYMYRCEKCQKVYDRCDHRYILSLQIGDHTGQTWVNAFNETGQQILGKSAEEMHYLKNNEAEYGVAIKGATFKSYIFRLRAKQESYQGENKLRINVMAVLPVDPEEECNHLIEQMEK